MDNNRNGKLILVVDDEKNIVDIITFNLLKEGYEVLTAFDGESGLQLAQQKNPDLILLDIMMPKMDGFEVCKKLRETSQIPIVLLTARAEEVDKVYGLESGADDYVTKPFGIRELMARVKANLRRTQPVQVTLLDFGAMKIDLVKFDVVKNGESINLTPIEFELIKFLASQKDQIFSREILLEKVWGYEYFGDVRTVDVTVRRLRMKVEDNPESPSYILTKRGVGYYFGG